MAAADVRRPWTLGPDVAYLNHGASDAVPGDYRRLADALRAQSAGV